MLDNVINIACCALLTRYHLGKWYALAVSRGNDTLDWGLPGGKMEPTDASPMEAMQRELLEETGLLEAGNAGMIYEAPVRALHPSGVDFVCKTWFVEAYRNQIMSSEEGITAWVPCSWLTRSTCTFAEYNREALRAWRRIVEGKDESRSL